MHDPIVTSLLDTDLYKFTMMQAVLHQFPAANVEYQFKCRNDAILAPYTDEIGEQIHALCELRFSEEELEYLRSLYFLKPDFIEFLRLFQLNKDFVHIDTTGEELELIIQGPWLHTILFEVPVLAIVNEVYFRNTQPTPDYKQGNDRLVEKIALIKNHPNNEDFIFSDFGTRRRFSKKWQFELMENLKNELPNHLAGTSNLDIARQLEIKPIGTMAHEFLQACQALGPRLADSQKFALESWAKEYRGHLGIALSDVVGIDAFLRDFDLYFVKLFDGMRHDSGDPIKWAEKAIAHYTSMKVDPKTKLLVFSDGLTVPKALALYDRFKDQAKLAFGIGTNLTNDLGYMPLQIVIKMTRCNSQPVAKISDSDGKTMCDDEGYLNYLAQVFKTTHSEKE